MRPGLVDLHELPRRVLYPRFFELNLELALKAFVHEFLLWGLKNQFTLEPLVLLLFKGAQQTHHLRPANRSCVLDDPPCLANRSCVLGAALGVYVSHKTNIARA